MRIVIADYSGHPFQVELSRCLASRGHDVLHLHFAGFQTPKGSLVAKAGDSPSFDVQAINLGEPFEKHRFLRRRIQEKAVGHLVAERALGFRSDVVVGCNMPLDAQRQLQRACRRADIAFVFWLQDIYSRAIDHYLSKRYGLAGRLVGYLYSRLEARLLRASDAIVAISEKFVVPLTEWGVERGRINVIPNWASLAEIRPAAKDNEWSRRHGLQDKLVALYTGTLGLKHDPALLLDLAIAGASIGLQLVVISEGPGADWLAGRKAALQLDNLILLPFQPMEDYSDVLGAGDILLAMVGEEASSFSVPSKILSYLAAGRPIVASIAADNDAAETIQTAAAGRIAMPGDKRAFIDQVLALASDTVLCRSLGANGRQYAERNFAIDPIVTRFENIFLAAIGGSGKQ